jgi:hypothetical protein
MFGAQIFERSTEHFSPHCYLNSTQNTRQLPRTAIQNYLQDVYTSVGTAFILLRGFISTQHELNFQQKQFIKLYHILSKPIHFTNWHNFSNGSVSELPFPCVDISRITCLEFY